MVINIPVSYTHLDVYKRQAIGKTLNSDKILELLLELYRFCRGKELFNEMVEDHYANWESDKSLVVGSVKKILKQLPDVDENFFESYYPEKEATKDYGEFLLLRTFGEDFVLLELIKPVLKNWDSERVAIIDMIILKMAVAELIFCTTIPPKVTLNEFVDVAKDYSTCLLYTSFPGPRDSASIPSAALASWSSATARLRWRRPRPG